MWMKRVNHRGEKRGITCIACDATVFNASLPRNALRGVVSFAPTDAPFGNLKPAKMAPCNCASEVVCNVAATSQDLHPAVASFVLLIVGEGQYELFISTSA